jgi:hypothetical protein
VLAASIIRAIALMMVAVTTQKIAIFILAAVKSHYTGLLFIQKQQVTYIKISI